MWVFYLYEYWLFYVIITLSNYLKVDLYLPIKILLNNRGIIISQFYATKIYSCLYEN